MKRILLFSFTLFIILFTSACVGNDNNSEELAKEHTYEEEEIDFRIEQILFSRSFQSPEPSVEVIPKNNKLRVMASLGLSEYSSVNINNILKKGNEVNIHVSGNYDNGTTKLAVPQIILELKDLSVNSANELKFNIVHDDYTLLKIKFSINDLLNKIQSHFMLSMKGMPDFSLNKINESLLWDIKYSSVFDRERPGIPLVNLRAKIDANSGDIIESEKVFISNTIDNGRILDYIPSKNILYKKTVLDEETNSPLEQLWSYDIEKRTKSMVYSTYLKVPMAEYSPDLKYISLIENNDVNSEVFIVTLEDLRAYKIFVNEKFKASNFKWSNGNILYVWDSNDETSVVYAYNIEDNQSYYINSLDYGIDNIVIKDNNYILVKKEGKKINKNIYFTTNWESYRDIGQGFRPRFIDENTLSFLQNNDKNDINSLIIYNIKERSILKELDDNIINYQILPDGNIVYIRKNTENNLFSLLKYNVKDDSISSLANFIGEKVYYDEKNNFAYLNIVLPFDDEKTELIYRIDLSKLN